MVNVDFTFRYSIINWFKRINFIGFRYVSNRISYWLIPKPKAEFMTVRTIYGFNMCVNPSQDIGLEKSIYYTGTYEPNTLSIIKQLIGNKDFVDVGANIGMMSIFAASLKPNSRIISFEVNPVTLEIFKKNIELNSIKNIEIISTGLGEEKSTVELYDNLDLNRGSSSILIKSQNSKIYKVEIDRFENIVNHSKYNIGLIKMDIEGYEYFALKGFGEFLNTPNSPHLIIECNKKTATLPTNEMVFELISRNPIYTFFKFKYGKSRKLELVSVKGAAELPVDDNLICVNRNLHSPLQF